MTYTYGAGIDEILFRKDASGQKIYFHTDHQGSTVLITDNAGATLKSYKYDAYGAVRQESGIIDNNPYLYTGRQMDPETGLYYYRTRFYDPQTGRFTRKDLWRGNLYQPLSLNRYLYCKNNPINEMDPWGLFDIEKITGKLTYGEYGGLGHSGNGDPIDQMDGLFKQHDEGYGKGQYEQADRDLSEGLKNLPQNPRDWNPPAPNPVEAERYRKIAQDYFEKAVKERDKLNKKK